MGYKGQKLTTEQRQRMSQAKRGRPSGFKGKQHTAESRKKMSEAATAVWQSRRSTNSIIEAIDYTLDKIEEFFDRDDQHVIDSANPRCHQPSFWEQIKNYIKRLK